jgi:hypothetical protein
MKRHHMSKLEGEDSMQRTNSIVLGLIAVFVLGGSLVLLSCGGGDNTTDITSSNAAQQLGGKQFTFSGETDFNVTVTAVLAFNSTASNFALVAGGRAVGSMSYGDGTCTFTFKTIDNAFTGGGPTTGLSVTADPCQTDQDNNGNLILNDTTSTGNVPNNGPNTVPVP